MRKARINYKFEQWREALESKGFQLSRVKLNIRSVHLVMEDK